MAGPSGSGMGDLYQFRIPEWCAPRVRGGVASSDPATVAHAGILLRCVVGTAGAEGGAKGALCRHVEFPPPGRHRADAADVKTPLPALARQ